MYLAFYTKNRYPFGRCLMNLQNYWFRLWIHLHLIMTSDKYENNLNSSTFTRGWLTCIQSLEEFTITVTQTFNQNMIKDSTIHIILKPKNLFWCNNHNWFKSTRLSCSDFLKREKNYDSLCWSSCDFTYDSSIFPVEMLICNICFLFLWKLICDLWSFIFLLQTTRFLFCVESTESSSTMKNALFFLFQKWRKYTIFVLYSLSSGIPREEHTILLENPGINALTKCCLDGPTPPSMRLLRESCRGNPFLLGLKKDREEGRQEKVHCCSCCCWWWDDEGFKGHSGVGQKRSKPRAAQNLNRHRIWVALSLRLLYVDGTKTQSGLSVRSPN